MNRDKQSKPSRPILRFYLLTAFALLLLCGLPDDAPAQTQWTTAPNGTDIYNTTSGNVGIGTTPTPGYRLHIAGDNTLAGGYPLIKIENKQTGGHAYWLYSGINNVAGDFGIFDSTNNSFGLVIKANSNVGIGTATPGYKLDVAGTINATSIYQNGSPFSSSQWTTGTGNISYSTGNVGIGTTAPTRRLTVVDSDANVPTLTLKTESSGMGLWDGFDLQFANSNAFVWNRENGAMMFGTNNAERLRISNAGNVGIGTATPAYKLDVAGTINATTIYQNGAPFSSSQWTTGGSNISYSSGNVGIGTATPGYKLDVAGTLNATSIYQNGSPFSSSQWATSGANISYSAGNVGIGVTAPGYKLDVGGTINATAIYQNGSPFGSSQWTTSGSNISYSTGDIGVGTTNPDSKLHIQGTAQLPSFTGTARGVVTISAPFTNLYHTALDFNYADGANPSARIAMQFSGSSGSSLLFGTSGNSASGITNTAMVINPLGNVGIGTTSPTKKLDVAGDINASGTITGGNIVAKYQDVAEWVPSTQAIAAATVVVLDTTKSNQVLPSTQAYDTRVAGVISARPGIALGEPGAGKVLVATTGRVKVRVDARRAPIRVGDLLVTGETEGAAMKSEPLDLGGVPIHRPGTLIGKALEPLEKGTGEILVLLSLQ
jgi:hypothetical protein